MNPQFIGDTFRDRVVLVVDDEAPILRVVTYVLQYLGCQAVTALDAETALEMLENIRPNLVISDVKLPGMDGVALAERIKKDPMLSSTPILLISAYGEPPRNPADSFLSKPFDIDELENLVGKFLHVT